MFSIVLQTPLWRNTFLPHNTDFYSFLRYIHSNYLLLSPQSTHFMLHWFTWIYNIFFKFPFKIEYVSCLNSLVSKGSSKYQENLFLFWNKDYVNFFRKYITLLDGVELVIKETPKAFFTWTAVETLLIYLCNQCLVL